MLEIGAKAPAFSLSVQKGVIHTLEQYETKYNLPFTLLSDRELSI